MRQEFYFNKALAAAPIDSIYPFIWLDAIHYKFKENGRYGDRGGLYNFSAKFRRQTRNHSAWIYPKVKAQTFGSSFSPI